MPNSNSGGIVNPYGAGNVRLDSTPYVNYELRQQAQKQAKDEALDKYFMDMEKNVTPAGMRTIDIPLLIEGKKKVQEFWLKNKRELRNPDLDDGKSLIEFSKLHNNNLATVQGSKNEVAAIGEFAKIKNDPNKSSLINDEIFTKVDANNKPLGSDGFVSMSDILNDEIFHAKPLTIAEQNAQFKLYSDIAGKPKPQIDPTKTIINPNNKLEDINTYVTKHDDKTLSVVGKMAADNWDNDPRTRITFSSGSLDNFDEAEKIAKRVLGGDFEIKTPKDKYIAETILHHSIPTIETKAEINAARKTAAANEEWRKRKAISDAYAQKQKDYSAALKTGKDNQWLENQLSDLETQSKTRVRVTDNKGRDEQAAILGAPTPVLKMFSVQGVEPDALAKYADGTYSPIFYKKDPATFSIIKNKNGGVIFDETLPVQKMSRSQLKAAYGKAFATGNVLTGQFDIDDNQQQSAPTQSTRPTRPTRFKGLPKTGKF